MKQVADERWPKARRLRKRSEIVAVREAGEAVRGRWFVAQVRRKPAEAPWKMGITVTKKVGNAVTRNRIKRWVREAARTTKPWPGGCDVVVLARKHAGQLGRRGGYREVCADLSRIARAIR